jgi:hypothetical protein
MKYLTTAEPALAWPTVIMKLKLTPRKLRAALEFVMNKGVTTCKTADRQEAMTGLSSLKLIYTFEIPVHDCLLGFVARISVRRSD